MIDKLDIRVPGHIPFTPGFAYLYKSMKDDPKRWRRTQHYSASASFEDCGIEATLHIGCTMTKKNMHKIEILRTGEKTYDEMLSICGRVFDTDPAQLGIMRVDLTADIPNVTVDWFKRKTMVRNKQTRREIGKVEPYQTVRKGRAETLYAGVKPNQIRIYDKTAERRMQYSRYLARFARESEGIDVQASTFEALYGTGMNDVVTRVERQIGAKDVEKMGLVRVEQLHRLPLMDPFANMLFFEHPQFDPKIQDFGTETWMAGMYLRNRVQDFGVSDTHQWMRATYGKNFDRAKKKFSVFLRLTDSVVGIDAKRLSSTFQASVTRQLLRVA
jgi:hypothetical protein